ncbi:MAG: ABC transporter permease subunit [Planctomycetes bacterium]|nr:ABC transporter permease subunit [Planctomycetota bacterium]
MPTVAESPAERRPNPFRGRTNVVVALVVGAVWSAWQLDLRLVDLIPSQHGLDVCLEFLSRALTPALSSEAEFVPANAPPFLVTVLEAAVTTVAFAAAAMGVAVVAGLVLGFLASTAWWSCVFPRGSALAHVSFGLARTVIALMRSVHELLWALLLVVAFGASEIAAVLALSIPTAGTLAKIYSELIDESPRDAAFALQAAGGTARHVFCFGLLPRALPDMIAYSFYRFECALRASAVLGFFGYGTLGLHLYQSFVSSNYGEVWTLLYALFAVVIGFDLWSGAIRRRLIG